MPFVFPDSMGLTEILSLAVASILVNNYILVQFLGCCSFFGVSKKTDTAIGMGMAVVFVMALASAVTWAVQYFILEPLDLQYMQTIAFILVIATLVQFVEMFMKKSMPALYSALGIFLPLITTNCAVLGAAISNIDNQLFVHRLDGLRRRLRPGLHAGRSSCSPRSVSVWTQPRSAPSALKASRSRWFPPRCSRCPSWASPACRSGKQGGKIRNGYSEYHCGGCRPVHHGHPVRDPAGHRGKGVRGRGGRARTAGA